MKKTVLFEDTVSYYNKWVSGQASREFSAISTKFKDLVGKTSGPDEQSPNDAKAGDVLPFPLPNTAAILGDLVTNLSNAQQNFKAALKHPLVQKDKKAANEINKILNCLKKSSNELNQIFVIIGKDSE
jgi:hypothetical protein